MFTAALAAMLVSAATAAAAKKPFNGNICAIPSGGLLAAAHISGGCINAKTLKRAPKPSPVGGTVGSVIYEAAWGKGPSAGGPSHSLVIEVTKALGSGRALALGRKLLRLKVIGHGYPLLVGNRGSLLTETASCLNPPTEDCTHSQALSIIGNYLVFVGVNDAPPTIPGAEPFSGEDEPQDNEQEDLIKGPTTAIISAVVAKL